MKNKPVVIIGGGGHASVVYDSLIECGREVLGFITPNREKGTSFCNSEVLGQDKDILKYKPQNIELANGIGFIFENQNRFNVAKKMREDGYSFTTIVHPSAILGKRVDLGEGVQIMAGSIVQHGTKIGNDTIINTGTILDHNCHIERNCHIATGVVCAGNIKIKNNTFIGAGSVIIHDISVGSYCMVAAGSVVFENLNDETKFIQKKHK